MRTSLIDGDYSANDAGPGHRRPTRVSTMAVSTALGGCLSYRGSSTSTRTGFTSTRTLPRGLEPGEVADHEEYVHQPECEPRRSDAKKPDQDKDQARLQEQQGVTEQPETIASPGVRSPLGIVDPAASEAP